MTKNLFSVGAYVRVWGGEEVVEASGGEGGSERGRRGEDRRGWVFSSLRIERTCGLLATNDFQPLVSLF